MGWFKRKKQAVAKDGIIEQLDSKSYLERIQDGDECGRSFEAKDFSDAHTEENLRHFKPLPDDKPGEPVTDPKVLSEIFPGTDPEPPTPEPKPEPPKQRSVSPPEPKSAPVPSPSTQELAETTWAVTERGKQIKHTEAEVNTTLRLLALNGGMVLTTVAALEEEGISVTRGQLEKWRGVQFPHRYLQIRKDLSREVGEKVAGDAMEVVQEITDVEKLYLEKALEKVDEVPAEHLAKNVAALAQAKGQNIERAQTLRHEPNEIIETRDVGTMIKELENLKVLKRDNAIDVESEEIE